MSRPDPSATLLCFGPFEADISAGQLRKRGLRIKLRRQSFDVLAALLEHPGRLVTRQQLRDRLWPQDIHVDFEDSLNTAVKHLRAALGESVAKPRYIETIPRLGYRFTTQVTSVIPGGVRDYRLLVLPFANLSGDPAQDYLTDGLTEEVIGQLALLDPRLLVLARTTSMFYQSRRKSVAAIAVELNLDYVLEGSVRHRAGRVRVTVQLIDARQQTHVWAHSFEGELTDFVQFQCEMARAVAREIRLPPVRPTPASVASAAYDIYLRGAAQQAKYTPPAMMAAVECLEAAIAVDPAFAKAWARLALTWAEMAFWTYAPASEAYPKAERAARRALEFDEALADAHRALGLVEWFYHWNMAACEREYRRALALNPASAPTRWGWFAFLASMKSDFAAAAREADLALLLDPHSVAMRAHVGWVYYWSRQHELAIHHCRCALEMDPHCLPAHYILGLAHLAEHRFADSIAAFQAAAALHNDSFSLAHLASTTGLAGDTQRAAALLAELTSRAQTQAVPPSFLAVAHLGLGHFETALEWLERALDEKDTHILWLRVASHWDPLRGHPRFHALIERLPLPQPAG